MMRFQAILLGAALVGMTIVAPLNSVQAEVCPKGNVVPPAKPTRIIRNQQFAYRFSLPENYRTMAIRENGILVFDPSSFERAQCLLRNRAPTEYPASISVYAEPVNPGNSSLATLVKQKTTAKIVETTTAASQPAVVYTTEVMGYLKNVSFLTPDRRYMITLSVPYQYSGGKWIPSRIFEEVFKTVLSTFTFVRG
jgi:hypothetical protein